VKRRRFNHLFEELSVALDQLAPRYALWLHMGEVGLDPDRLSGGDVESYCHLHLTGFLEAHDLTLAPRLRRRFERTVIRFDPARPTPYEHMDRLGGPRQPRP
jgi:hypothetical protein